MKLIIDEDEGMYDWLNNGFIVIDEDDKNNAVEAIKNGQPLSDDCEILTKEAYSDLCLRASRAEQEEITLEQAINRLYELGWLQEHDRILAESNGHCEFVNLPPYAKEECADAISRQALRDKLNERHDFYIKAWGGSFENMPIEDKARVDEISACIAEVVNAPSVKPKAEECEDCISLESAKEAMYALCDEDMDNLFRENPHIDAIIETLDNLPSVKLKSKEGKWLPTGYDGYSDGEPVVEWWECSECGYEHEGDYSTLSNYCPNCGAFLDSNVMVEDDDEEIDFVQPRKETPVTLHIEKVTKHEDRAYRAHDTFTQEEIDKALEAVQEDDLK